MTAAILELEARRITAMVNRDVATLDTLLADDLSYTHSAGHTDTKSSFLALIREGTRYLGVEFLKAEVASWGGNAAVVRGQAEIRLDGVAPYPVTFVDVWARRGSGWQLVAWQATRAAAGK